MSAKKSLRPAFSLIELLVVMAVLAVVTGALAMLMNETLEAERIQAASYERLQQCRVLADQFRADVAHAASAPSKCNNHVAGADTLILQMKGKEHVVYLWNEQTLKRLEVEGDVESERTLAVPARTLVEFHRAAPEGKLIRLRLTTVPLQKGVPGQSLEFAAALGGDWR